MKPCGAETSTFPNHNVLFLSMFKVPAANALHQPDENQPRLLKMLSDGCAVQIQQCGQNPCCGVASDPFACYRPVPQIMYMYMWPPDGSRLHPERSCVNVHAEMHTVVITLAGSYTGLCANRSYLIPAQESREDENILGRSTKRSRTSSSCCMMAKPKVTSTS